ncbi:surface carbohydrate biosynthesis protein [Roseinatronobacter sp. S2]|uniref:surface carbohydrate biosynthesis protein n=1 Tax=Roseinatronobacter sp. S2 TaxID=3035471 RepID=UPI00241008EE|nr:surface carbohydrate biosynthesis protein [Roseinatronobacter sp. S2]WFE74188.1 hypothetical protein P8S53_13495 [Roseinatronobacter sp. S2]
MRRHPDRKKEIFFPIEIKPREFVSRALLGAFFADKGYRVYLGAKGPVNKAVLSKPERGGVYFYKGIRQKADTPSLLEKVDTFCVLDEEIGVAARYLNERLEQRVKGMDRVDKFFTISRYVADAVVRACPEAASKVSVTGWPKVDTWRPEMRHMFRRQAESYNQRFGEFVLFTSDFGVLSRARANHEIAHIKKIGFPDAYVSSYISGVDSTLADFDRFCDELRSYDALPDAPPLIVRPHPAEDREVWDQRLNGMRRVSVVYENEVSGWLQACRMLVHRGCTTAVQARVGGKPAFFWAPENTSPETGILPYEVSAKLGALSEILTHWADPSASMRDIAIPAYKLEMGEKLSSERIFDEVDSLGIVPTLPVQIRLRKRFSAKLKAIRRRIINSNTFRTRQVVDPLRARKLQDGFHAAELESYLVDAFPMGSYKVTQLAPDLILLEGGSS